MKRAKVTVGRKRATRRVSRLTDYRGRTVQLTQERWLHIIEHSEMAGQSRKLRSTLRNPDRVFTSRLDPTVHLYYRWFPRSPVGPKHLMAAVKLLEEDAFMITAFFTDDVKGGAEVWAR